MSALAAAAALLIRLLLLRSRFPYIDDLLQLYAVTRPGALEAARATAGIGPLQPPLDYAVDFLAARLTADLTALRLLPAAWGALSAAVACRLGTRLHGRELGAWWAALIAVSMPLVSFSLTLRHYSLGVLLGLLSWSALDELLDGGKAWPFALAQTLFQLAYPHAWMLGLAHLAVAARRRTALRPLVLALLPSWAALAAWLACWHLAVSADGGFHYAVPWSALGGVLRAFNQGRGPGLLLYPVLIALGAAAARRPGPVRGFVRTAALSLAPLAAIFAAHRAEKVLLLPRHALPLLPAYLGLAAAGCAEACRLAAARSRRAGLAARAALAAGLAWSAIVPLAALAGREAFLSGYVRDFAADLERRAGPSDALVFADPNTGATLLHLLDRSAFDALSGIRMRRGFALFEFPPRLEAAVGPRRLAACTLCLLDPALATIDAARLRALRGRGRVWMITLDGLNAIPRDEPFAALGVGARDLLEVGPGLFLLR